MPSYFYFIFVRGLKSNYMGDSQYNGDSFLDSTHKERSTNMTIKIGILGYKSGMAWSVRLSITRIWNWRQSYERRDKESLNILTPGQKVCSGPGGGIREG